MASDKDLNAEDGFATDLPQEDQVSREASTPDYEVGYGKPPRSTRFQPGQSGNPRGRPKGSRNLKTDLIEELQETIDIREGNRTRKITKQRAFIKALTNGSIKGNARSSSLLIGTMLRVLDTGANDAEVDDGLTAEEAEILRDFEARISKRAIAAAKSAEGPGRTEPEEES